MTSSSGAWKRWPRVLRPGHEAQHRGVEHRRRPSSITIQWAGRTNSASPLPQRMRRGIGSAASAAVTMPVSSSAAGRPGAVALWNSQAPLGVSTRPRASTGTPQPSAKASGRAGRRAVGIERDRHGRAALLDHLHRLLQLQVADQHREPAGRREGAQAGEAEARAAQSVLDAGSAKARSRSASDLGGSSSVPISTRKSAVSVMAGPGASQRPLADARASMGKPSAARLSW